MGFALQVVEVRANDPEFLWSWPAISQADAMVLERHRETEVDASGRRVVSAVSTELATVTRIVELRTAGHWLPAIARAMAQENRPTKLGGRWTPEGIRRVLRRTSTSAAIA